MPIPGDKMRAAKIRRIADPMLGLAVAGLVSIFSRPLGIWLMIASFTFAMVEQIVYDKQLNEQLDQLDNMIDSEVLAEVSRTGPQGSRRP